MEDAFRRAIDAAAAVGPAELLATWREWHGAGRGTPEAALRVARELIDGAMADDALDVLDHAGESVRARQLRGLALRKTGNLDEAIRILEPLHREHQLDPETAGILAGSYKQRAAEHDNRTDLQAAFLLYSDTFRATDSYYLGINAASLSLLLGNRGEAAAIAARLKERLGADPATLDAWGLATLAEAHLLLGELEDARTWYRRAVATNPNAVERIATMRRQARTNLRALRRDTDALDDILVVRAVAAFTGHMTDAPDRSSPRFPERDAGTVRRRLRERLKARSVGFGFASLARGADILFLEELLERGGAARVVLPFPYEAFATSSIGPAWKERADRILGDPRVRTRILRADVPPESERSAAYLACFHELAGDAVRFAKVLGDEPLLVAVWNGEEGDGGGGTAAAVAHWRGLGLEEEIVLVAAAAPEPSRERGQDPLPPATREAYRREPPRRPAGEFEYAARYCACIGVSEYLPPPWSRLPNARNDAEEVARALASSHDFDDPLLLCDQDVTEQALRVLITDTLRNLAGPDDLVVVFFAGHGHTVRMSGQEHGFIVPATARDAEEGLPPRTVRGDEPFKLVSINTLTDWSAWLECRHLLYVFDSCFSGMFQRMSGGDRLTPDVTRARLAITAGRADQPVYDGGAATAHSVFTDALLEALRNGVGTGEDFTATELYTFLRRRVSRKFPEQTPTLATLRNHEGGEILFRQPAR